MVGGYIGRQAERQVHTDRHTHTMMMTIGGYTVIRIEKPPSRITPIPYEFDKYCSYLFVSVEVEHRHHVVLPCGC